MATRRSEGIDFSLRAGETLALVGESGSGKSQTAHALLRLLPAAARLGGSVRLTARNCSPRRRRHCWRFVGSASAWCSRPMTSLNPLQRIGRQVGEVCACIAACVAPRCAGGYWNCSNWPASSSRDACSRPIRTSSPAASDSE